MTNSTKITIDLEKMLSKKLKVEEYFVLFCLVNKEKDTLAKYVTLCGIIEARVFYKLRDSGFIVLKDDLNITFESIEIKEETNKLFNIQSDTQFNDLFIELLSTYPSKVKKVTGGIRRLHNNLESCKESYKNTLTKSGIINIELHKKILLCVKLYYREHLKGNEEAYMQLLSTFLSQKTWEQYLSEIENITELPKQTSTIDAI